MSEGKIKKTGGKNEKTRGLRYKVCEVDNVVLEQLLNNLDERATVVSMYAINQLKSMLVYQEPVDKPQSLRDFATIVGKKRTR